MTTPLAGLSEIAESVANQVPTHNLALRQWEARTIRALSMITMSPPAAVEGDSYIIPAGATGAWSGKTAQIASFIGGAWSYYAPVEGIRLWISDLDAEYVFDGAAWITNGGDASGDIAAAIATHEAADNPHPAYLTQAEADVLYAPDGSASVAAHVAEADPHAQYAREGTVNVFTKNQSVAAVSLGSGVSPAIDAALSNNFKITLGANNTLVDPTNLTEGMILNFAITQDATGGRTLAYGSLFKFPGGTVPTLSTAANAKDFMSCYFDGGVLLCSLNKGFA